MHGRTDEQNFDKIVFFKNTLPEPIFMKKGVVFITLAPSAVLGFSIVGLTAAFSVVGLTAKTKTFGGRC